MPKGARFAILAVVILMAAPFGAKANHNCHELKAYTGVSGGAGVNTGTAGCARPSVDPVSTFVAFTGSDFYIHAYVGKSDTCNGVSPSGGSYVFKRANGSTIKTVTGSWTLASNNTFRLGTAQTVPDNTATITIGGVSVNGSDCVTRTRSISVTVLA